MKILFLNPHIDAEHAILQALKTRGVAVLQPSSPEEALQILKLHGTSVELAILHREFPNDPDGGIKLLAKIKADPNQSDLPAIVTSEKWGDEEFARHQDSPQGANAYSKWPVSSDELVGIIEAVFGEPLGEAPPPQSQPEARGVPPKMTLPPGAPKPPSAPPSAGGGLVLEDASNLFSRSDKYEASDTSIRLEAPSFEPGAAPSGSGSISIPTALSPSEPEGEAGGIEISGEASGEGSALEHSSGPAAGGERPPVDGIELPVSESASIPTATGGDAGSAEPAPGISLEVEPSVAPPSAFDPSALQLAEPGGAERGPGAAGEVIGEVSTHAALEALGGGPPEAADSSGELDREAAAEMPYLFSKSGKGQPQSLDPAVAFAQPMGDAVVPGGAAQAPDIETLKKYLLLREQDVAVLSTQLKSAKEQVQALEEIVREERGRNVEATHTINEQRRKIEEFEKEKAALVENLQGEIGELKFQLKAKADKGRVLEAQVREATEEMERLKERVRSDIRKIRVREKELENRLEIVKKDSEALIAAREGKIIELKRKLDLLEFNMDLLQDQHAREKESSAKLRERLAKAAQVVRVAGGLLDQNGKPVALEDPESEAV